MISIFIILLALFWSPVTPGDISGCLATTIFTSYLLTFANFVCLLFIVEQIVYSGFYLVNKVGKSSKSEPKEELL